MDRIDKLCSYLTPCKSFADVGCDHGYCTRYMLERGLCKEATISDISPKCLKKARDLLKEYEKSGVLSAVCCDGLEKIDPSTELVLIAGMGGDEIISILKKSFIPKNFVFQPMKNAPRLRSYLIGIGAHISRDEVFDDGGKFYFVLCGKRSGERTEYSKAELMFGKQLQSPILKKYLEEELEKRRAWLLGAKGSPSEKDMQDEINFMEGVLKGEIG